VLASITLTTLIARGLPRVEHVRSQHWKPHHDRIAWLLVGLVWWFAATAGALGFGLAATMATLLLADKLRRQTRQAHAANPAP
jgi:Na+/glutamate symporter